MHWSMYIPTEKLYDDFTPITWADIKEGDIVFIDSYEGGKFPQANPRICGPFTVEDGIQHRWLRNMSGRSFMHYPNNLLRKVVDFPAT